MAISSPVFQAVETSVVMAVMLFKMQLAEVKAPEVLVICRVSPAIGGRCSYDISGPIEEKVGPHGVAVGLGHKRAIESGDHRVGPGRHID